MKVTYRNENGIMIPNLKVPDTPKTPLGLYGRMRRDYLKQNHRSIYSAMMLQGTLLAHLVEIDKTCHEEFEIRVKAMSDAQILENKRITVQHNFHKVKLRPHIDFLFIYSFNQRC